MRIHAHLLVLAVALVPGVALGDLPKLTPPRPAPAKPPSTKPAPAKPALPKPTPARAASPKKPPPGPVAASRGWHATAAGQTCPSDPTGRPQLVLQALNMPDHVTLTAHTEHGGFSAEDLDRAAHLLRDPRTGNEHPIDPRVLDLVYRVSVHFNVPEVRIISGYRTPHTSQHSNHNTGRAIDCVFPGANDEDVAKFAREEGYSGVGTYPVSGFVHLDVRDRSYFWVDNSGPGKKNRTRGILGDLAAKSDQRAAARGERGCGPFGIGSDVDGALAAVNHTTNPANAPEEDEEDDAVE